MVYTVYSAITNDGLLLGIAATKRTVEIPIYAASTASSFLCDPKTPLWSVVKHTRTFAIRPVNCGRRARMNYGDRSIGGNKRILVSLTVLRATDLAHGESKTEPLGTQTRLETTRDTV